MAGKHEDLEIVIGADLDGLAADLKKGARLVADFARDTDRMSPKPSDFNLKIDVRGIRAAGHEAKEATSSLRGMAGSMAGFTAKAAIAGGTLMALQVGVAGISDAFLHLKESVSMAAEVEQTTLSFEVMLGSAERAKTMVADLRKFAAETPFGSRETIDAARQLKAYGIAADQIIPTLTVLGDITAGLGGRANLGEMAYLYGTLASQGRAFSKDIYQFTNKGVDLLPGLAEQFKVTKAEVMGIVEEGRVGFPEVGKALERLRGPGGQFENLMKRQAETLAGSWEQAKDALDLAKIKFGQILIRDLGLKDAVKNLEEFGNRLERDMERISPFVRQVGNIAHTVGHLAVEFGNASLDGLKFADLLANTAFPEISQAAKELEKDFDHFLKQGKDFKIKPSVVSQMVFIAADELSTFFIEALRGIKDIGEALRREIVVPLAKGFDDFFREFYGKKASLGLIADKERFRPPTQFEPDAEIVRRYRELDTEIVQLQRNYGMEFDEKTRTVNRTAMNPQMAVRYRQNPFVYEKEFMSQLAPLLNFRKDFAAAFEGGENVWAPHGKLLVEGIVPPMKARQDVAIGEKGFLSRAIADLTARQMNMRASNEHLLMKLLADEAKQAALALHPFSEQAALTSGFGPYGFLVPAAMEFQRGSKPSRLEFPDQPNSTHAEIAKELRNKYDPLNENGKLMAYRKNLEQARRYGLIDPHEFELGWRDAVKEVADRLGVGQQAKLAPTTIAGSQEDARLLSQFLSGQQKTTTDDLLKQIRDVLLQIKLSAEKSAGRPLPLPVDFGGGGSF